MADTWLWLPRASNGTPLLVNLSNVSHMDPHFSPDQPVPTTHLCFGTDDYSYALEVRGTPEDIVSLSGIAPANMRPKQGEDGRWVWPKVEAPTLIVAEEVGAQQQPVGETQ